MDKFKVVKKEFQKNGGILKTAELKDCNISSRQIKKLLDDGVISRVKHGYYELSDYMAREEVVIARLFPKAVIYLESALLHYGYTDRISTSWQIAVNKNSEKTQYDIDYPFITPFYIKSEFLDFGIGTFEVEGITVKIFDRDRTICDTLRYEKKLEKEVFNKAIQSYIKDDKKNIRNLFHYANVLNIKGKVQTYIGVWL
ncbi:type IV toxin-antitoxin system AbiEi family antitoxin domain-containing protein [Virgibacillus sp. CBA3643]|uniref:type IV toxin-antitoxin system AbiEi family antitoxin domain-containing protein n=1 Tax=Virgibacillus sp. CBA3643 TaxID=2942278 RepID=UPI0035A303CB